MDIILLLKALIMGIVEGLTEFLPVSSTGHLIIAGDLLSFLEKDQRGVFEIFIQLGAILAVVWEYRRKIISALAGAAKNQVSRQFLFNLQNKGISMTSKEDGMTLSILVIEPVFLPTFTKSKRSSNS